MLYIVEELWWKFSDLKEKIEALVILMKTWRSICDSSFINTYFLVISSTFCAFILWLLQIVIAGKGISVMWKLVLSTTVDRGLVWYRSDNRIETWTAPKVAILTIKAQTNLMNKEKTITRTYCKRNFKSSNR